MFLRYLDQVIEQTNSWAFKCGDSMILDQASGERIESFLLIPFFGCTFSELVNRVNQQPRTSETIDQCYFSTENDRKQLSNVSTCNFYLLKGDSFISFLSSAIETPRIDSENVKIVKTND